MKQKDLTTIIVSAFISGVLGIILAKFLISPPKNRQSTVIHVDPISADFQKPDPKYFNTNSIDPTKTIKIGDSTNKAPFKEQ